MTVDKMIVYKMTVDKMPWRQNAMKTKCHEDKMP